MKVSHSWQFNFGSELGLAIMWACIACSYFSLAKATTALPVGVAFALWDAIGLVFILLFYVSISIGLKVLDLFVCFAADF